MFDRYVDAINATDGSGANCHMSSLAVCALLTRVGYAPVMQISCRDRNRIAIQGDILGCAAMGVCNLLCLSGDGVQAGDHPQALPVFDLDSISLLATARTLREGEHRFLERPQDFPCAPVAAGRGRKSLRRAGAMAGPKARQESRGRCAVHPDPKYCYSDIPVLRSASCAKWKTSACSDKVFILVGVGPFKSAKAADWMRTHVPGVHIPDEVIKRLSGAEDGAREGRHGSASRLIRKSAFPRREWHSSDGLPSGRQPSPKSSRSLRECLRGPRAVVPRRAGSAVETTCQTGHSHDRHRHQLRHPGSRDRL